MPVVCEYAVAYFAKTRISHIFYAYNGIFKMAHARIMSHICKNLHISAYAIAFLAFSLYNVVLRPLYIFGGSQLLGISN